jgi:hypothetical protein
MRTFLFRILARDYNGHPLAHGVLRATDLDDAERLVAEQLHDEFEFLDSAVRLYPLDEVAHGAFGNTEGFVERPIEFGEGEEVEVDFEAWLAEHPDVNPLLPGEEGLFRELAKIEARTEQPWRARVGGPKALPSVDQNFQYVLRLDRANRS